jgi:HNH endonuclease
MTVYEYTPKDAIRFWSKVAITNNPDNCWEWQAARTDKDYGHFMVGGRKGGTEKTHRVAWCLTYGQIPDGLWVLHKCDNPPCCNPKHLFLGTSDDNIRDMVSKRRNSTGEQHGLNHIGELNVNSKLTADKVRYIRCRYASGDVNFTELGREMCVNRSTIAGIVKQRLWKHID